MCFKVNKKTVTIIQKCKVTRLIIKIFNNIKQLKQ